MSVVPLLLPLMLFAPIAQKLHSEMQNYIAARREKLKAENLHPNITKVTSAIIKQTGIDRFKPPLLISSTESTELGSTEISTESGLGKTIGPTGPEDDVPIIIPPVGRRRGAWIASGRRIVGQLGDKSINQSKVLPGGGDMLFISAIERSKVGPASGSIITGLTKGKLIPGLAGNMTILGAEGGIPITVPEGGGLIIVPDGVNAKPESILSKPNSELLDAKPISALDDEYPKPDSMRLIPRLSSERPLFAFGMDRFGERRQITEQDIFVPEGSIPLTGKFGESLVVMPEGVKPKFGQAGGSSLKGLENGKQVDGSAGATQVDRLSDVKPMVVPENGISVIGPLGEKLILFPADKNKPIAPAAIGEALSDDVYGDLKDPFDNLEVASEKGGPKSDIKKIRISTTLPGIVASTPRVELGKPTELVKDQSPTSSIIDSSSNIINEAKTTNITTVWTTKSLEIIDLAAAQKRIGLLTARGRFWLPGFSTAIDLSTESTVIPKSSEPEGIRLPTTLAGIQMSTKAHEIIGLSTAGKGTGLLTPHESIGLPKISSAIESSTTESGVISTTSERIKLSGTSAGIKMSTGLEVIPISTEIGKIGLSTPTAAALISKAELQGNAKNVTSSNFVSIDGAVTKRGKIDISGTQTTGIEEGESLLHTSDKVIAVGAKTTPSGKTTPEIETDTEDISNIKKGKKSTKAVIEKSELEEVGEKGKPGSGKKSELEEVGEKEKSGSGKKSKLEEVGEKGKSGSGKKSELEEDEEKEKTGSGKKTELEEDEGKGKLESGKKSELEEVGEKEKSGSDKKSKKKLKGKEVDIGVTGTSDEQDEEENIGGTTGLGKLGTELLKDSITKRLGKKSALSETGLTSFTSSPLGNQLVTEKSQGKKRSKLGSKKGLKNARKKRNIKDVIVNLLVKQLEDRV